MIRSAMAALLAVALITGAHGKGGKPPVDETETEPAGGGAEQPAVDPTVVERTHVVLLGTGTPNTDPTAQGPSLAVVVNGTPYTVDCGPGIVRRASAAYLAGVEGLEVSRLNTAFITHLHSDHTVGYPDLIFSPWVMGRSQPLRVFGPPGIAKMTEHIQAAYAEDIAVRLEGLEPATEDGYKVEATEIGTGQVYQDGNVTVHAFQNRHGAWDISYGFRFVTPEADICISGDTAPYDAMAEHYAGCDLLIHEVYLGKAFPDRDPVWQEYHKASHTSGPELAAIASAAKPRLLVATHLLLWGQDEDELAKEIGAAYEGELLIGSDLTLIGVSEDFVSGRNGKPAGSFVVVDL